MTAGASNGSSRPCTAAATGSSRPVDELPDGAERAVLPIPSDLRQEIRFCTTTDGTALAYATVGTGRRSCGPPTGSPISTTTGRVPVWRHWLVGLARQRTLVRYDERGCGLSDHDVDDFSLDAWVRGSRDRGRRSRARPLPAARRLARAARSRSRTRPPSRAGEPARAVRRLRPGPHAAGHDATSRSAKRCCSSRWCGSGWGREDAAFRRFFTSSFIPDAPPELWESFAELLRRTTSAENAARLLEAWADIDVTEEATRVTAPTLVLHARDELRVPWNRRGGWRR